MASAGVRRARGRGGVAVAAIAPAAIALVLAWVPSAAEGARGPDASGSAGRVAIVFLPWPESAGGDRALIGRLAAPRRALSLGLTSPTVGGYGPEQVGLDMSQGARVPVGLYGGPPPSLELLPFARSGRARIAGWDQARRRAAGVPGTLVPGLLADTVRTGGGRVTYVGGRRAAGGEAAVAADRSGSAAVAAPARAGGSPGELASRWRAADLLVACVPGGEAGLATLDELLGARAPGDLVYVVRAPPPAAARAPLLATGIAGPGFAPTSGLTSATTRRRGLVAATDVAPTVLGRLGMLVPAAMQGQAIEARPGAGGAQATLGLHDRLTAVVAGRPPALLALLAGWLVAVAALALARGRAGARAALRLGLLAALWFPGLALATAALATEALTAGAGTSAVAAAEPLGLALGSLALAGVTDRLVPWPRGPALPAAAVLCAYGIDLALGSRLTALALTGPNPAGGARFFGLGNELEALLSVSLLLGVGAAASRTRLRPAAVATAFVAAGLAAVAVMGSGRLGADVGAAATLGAGAAVAAGCALSPGGRPRRVVAVALLGPAAALAALAALDAVTGGDAHLSRSVLSGGPDGLRAALERRAATQIDLLGSPLGAVVAAAGIALLAVLAVRWRAVCAPLWSAGARPLAGGLAGALAAILVGAVANDSAPDMLAIGAVLGLLATSYVLSGPEGAGRPAPGPTSRPDARVERPSDEVFAPGLSGAR